MHICVAWIGRSGARPALEPSALVLSERTFPLVFCGHGSRAICWLVSLHRRRRFISANRPLNARFRVSDMKIGRSQTGITGWVVKNKLSVTRNNHIGSIMRACFEV